MVHSAVIQIQRMPWKRKYSCGVIPTWGILYAKHAKPYETLDLVDQEAQPSWEVTRCVVQLECTLHFWHWNKGFYGKVAYSFYVGHSTHFTHN